MTFLEEKTSEKKLNGVSRVQFEQNEDKSSLENRT